MSRIERVRFGQFMEPENSGPYKHLGLFDVKVEKIKLTEIGPADEITTQTVDCVKLGRRTFRVHKWECSLPHDMKKFPVKQMKAVGKTPAEKALAMIQWARDYHAEFVSYPSCTMYGDQQFDDWAADLAAKALREGK